MYKVNPRYRNEPEDGGSSQVPSRKQVDQPYAATVALTTTHEKSIYLFETITGNIALSIGVSNGQALEPGTGNFDGDEIYIKLPCDSTGGRIITFGAGCTPASPTIVLAANQTGFIAFMYDGATSTWVETSRSVSSNLVVVGAFVKTQNPYTASTDTTAGWTLAKVTAGILAGVLKSTSVAAVTMTLDSVANILTAFAAAGIQLAAGSTVDFIIDNSQGANTITLADDGGATITVSKQISSGDSAVAALLTVAAAGAGKFSLYITSATTAILQRLG